jgi:hypothetical protein
MNPIVIAAHCDEDYPHSNRLSSIPESVPPLLSIALCLLVEQASSSSTHVTPVSVHLSVFLHWTGRMHAMDPDEYDRETLEEQKAREDNEERDAYLVEEYIRQEEEREKAEDEQEQSEDGHNDDD